MIDGIDGQILTILQQDARASNAEIARQVGLAPSAVLERVRKLEERRVIRGYSVDIDPPAIDFGLTAIVAVRTSECGDGVGDQLAAVPEILEVHEVAGEDCFYIKIRTRDTESLGRLLRERIKAIPRVLNTNTTVVLKTFKESVELPIAIKEDTRSRAKGK
ncbi:MAG: Lrp/AsnC family transcriptional regulator [Pyrinomonadaceae bacterium]